MVDEFTESVEVRGEETKNEAFRRVSEGRINKVVESLRILTNMAGMPNYEYSEEEIEKMFSHIEKALDKSKKAFEKDFSKEFKW